MLRYNKITGKNKREIVLLKSHPCRWGQCTFCDYIDDNSLNQEDMVNFNRKVLKNVTGEFNKLEVINSASVFDLPLECLSNIRDTVKSKGIKTLYFESHYIYKNRLSEIRDYFEGVDIIFKCGIESFNHEFRNNFLNKGVYFKDYKEVAKHFKSICLLVGIEGQTKDMIRKDMEIVENHFQFACINIYIENSTPIKRDEDLITWFKEKYSYLEGKENIEVLWNNTDFGVGGGKDEY